MEMIRHQDVFAHEHAACPADLAKLSEIFVDSGVGENRFAGFGAGGNEVERMAGEKSAKTLESSWRL
jgi:hypothetical protein